MLSALFKSLGELWEVNLPKTYWDDLSERSKERFAYFYLWCTASRGYYKICGNCPGVNFTTIMAPHTKECNTLCSKLFRTAHFKAHGGSACPCKVYGSTKAAEAFKKCLIEDGWIEDD